MSRGLGKMQVKMLQGLARGPMACTESELGFFLGSSVLQYDRDIATAKQALYSLERRGLARRSRYYPNKRGQPRIWEITPAGREALK